MPCFWLKAWAKSARSACPLPPEGIEHAWYKFYAFVEPEVLAPGWSRDRILSEITETGYPAFSVNCSGACQER